RSIWAARPRMWRWHRGKCSSRQRRASTWGRAACRCECRCSISIRWARVDAGSSLLVGPESAGASPGPACYGVGLEATVTDAHVVLGRIAPDQLAGGAMRIDPERAKEAVERVGAKLGLSAWHAAAAIIRVANSNMERAIRVVSVERGEDPREYPLIAFGGCGGLHACEIAEELGIRTMIAPRMAGA